MNNLKEKLFKLIENKESEMIEIRRHLHQHPELSFEEVQTADYIKSFYKDKDVKVTQPLDDEYAIIVEINGGREGQTIGLRADFDALPIEEETDVPFKSENEGVMHACGHDVHTAYLMGLADALIEIKEELPGTVKIIHQHAEEKPPGGAKAIVESGVLDDLDEVYGIHIVPVAGPEFIGYNKGPSFSGSSTFKLTINGLGGHAASPHKTHDALIAGTNFVNAIQTIVSRRIDPLDMGVVTIGAFEAPGGYNVIQDSVTIKGTARYLNPELEETMYQEIKKIADSIAVGFDIEYDLDYQYGYPVLYNHIEQTEKVAEILSESKGDYFQQLVEIPQVTGSEDFAYYLQKIPGSFYIVGSKPEGVTEPYMNHHPKFDVNEDCMLVAAKSLAEITLNRLENK
ncbi:M20 metallopeptidase family protein [Mammaliicoccus fleurettii]|uniref:M20 metallopeptidase family protein n=1 Tax=Mammaliicoccus fleurettii TaxID=150056 RepID=UPI0009922D3B|nr:amidohydrolase [Mammaliicoccus fleurettii]MBO3063343.1 amidohydrolase [Mammaliicoccus fleurettii]MEB7723972.1 amidohydrolase [Mammaliicoccus fleurettii]MEB7780961.1 amidohydrolase [Mammaliicoccus fleurettii]MEB8069057.1 amidohydrolase [Mammaliicoccus fleurettii]OOV77279.1 amidohydrolase [Mammaliicoccus fleurettii]